MKKPLFTLGIVPILESFVILREVYHWPLAKTPWKAGHDWRHNHIDHYLRCLDRLEREMK